MYACKGMLGVRLGAQKSPDMIKMYVFFVVFFGLRQIISKSWIGD